MFLKAVLLVISAFGCFAPAAAAGRGKVNLYWGQSGVTRLADACAKDGVNYVTLAFVNKSPEKGGATGYPGTNFGAHCGSATYTVNGQASYLLSNCSQIAQDIPKCQALGTKVLLSIGGAWSASSDYTVTTPQRGEAFAAFLWGAFGPYKATWAGPRPFGHAAVDGFDFDVEKKFADQTPWIAMINKLRSYFPAGGGGYIIAGAPQCPLSDAFFQMKDMIAGAQFDVLWVQFYNNPACDGLSAGFNFDAWVKFLVGTRSAHATLYVGLPGSPAAAGSGYLSPAKLQALLRTYASRPSFGGVALWDASLAEKNVDASGRTYVQVVKSVLATVGPAGTPTARTPPATTSPCVRKYTAAAGDYCYAVAARLGTTVDEIMARNPKLNSYCDLAAGQVLCLPPLCAQKYTVVSGDTCWAIATGHGITVAQLEAYNPSLGSACQIQVGQVLCVKQASGTAAARKARAVSAAVTTVTTVTPSAVRLSAATGTAASGNGTVTYGTGAPASTHTVVYAGAGKHSGRRALASALAAAVVALVLSTV